MAYSRYQYDRYSQPGDAPRPPRRSIKEVTRVPKNRSQFRAVARDASGETFDPPDEDRLAFLYEQSDKEGNKLVGVACYHYADSTVTEPGKDFDSGYFHTLTYLFIRPHHQKKGHGRALLKFVENLMMKNGRRNIHVQSAGPALGFFERNGYVRHGDAMECVCSGSSRFSRLYNMEKAITDRGRK